MVDLHTLQFEIIEMNELNRNILDFCVSTMLKFYNLCKLYKVSELSLKKTTLTADENKSLRTIILFALLG